MLSLLLSIAMKPTEPAPELGIWIQAPTETQRLPIFRKAFRLDGEIQEAKLRVVGLGAYKAFINGKPVANRFCDPPWTDYKKLILYQTFDVRPMLLKGQNAIGVMLGNGVYNVVGGRYVKFIGSYGPPKMTAVLSIKYRNGRTEEIKTDGAWKVTEGPIVFSCHFGGEDFDASLVDTDWSKATIDDSSWAAAIETHGPGGELQPSDIRGIEYGRAFKTVSMKEPKKGVWIYDLGQNIAAVPRLKVKGAKGKTVKLVPSELLGEDGLAWQGSCGGPVSFSYTLAGRGTEAWSPLFTYFGYRYVQVEGAVPAGKPNPEKLPVVVSLESVPVTYECKESTFETDNELVNRIYNLIDKAIQSNTQTSLTDCPHREKLGWLEQDHLMGPSVLYSRDVADLMFKICRDMRLSQLPNGLVPDISPEYVVFEGGFRDSPEWGSACTLVPWQLYEFTGNKKALEDNYEMMKRYAAYLESQATDSIVNHGLGDWYDVGPNPPGYAQLTPIAFTATAFYFRDLDILANAARILGKTSDVEIYAAKAAKVKETFNKNFFDKDKGRYAEGSQCANAIGLVMGLCPKDSKAKVLDSLVKDVQNHNYRTTAGDVGYRYVIRALADGGRSDVVYKMATVDGKPGYAYQLSQGATALTEAWDALKSSSQNHFMLGHVMEWFYTDLAGIKQAPGTVGFKELVIHPYLPDGVNHVKASCRPNGQLISVEWTKKNDSFEIVATLPKGVQATVILPSGSGVSLSGKAVQIGGGTTTLKCKL